VIGQRTHDYPHGKPPLLAMMDITMLIVGIFWVGLASRGWRNVLVIVTLFISIAIVRSRLLTAYERSGEAVRLPRATEVVYRNGIPALMRVLRYTFVVFVAVLLFFGVAPISMPVAKTGMISAVVSIFATGVVHFWLERHYVNSGRADEQYDKPSGA
jgi:hypothetical protein